MCVWRGSSREGGKRKKHQCRKESSMPGETSIRCRPTCPEQSGTKLSTQACVLTQTRTPDFSVYRMMLHPAEPHGPGSYNEILISLKRQENSDSYYNKEEL